MNTLWTAHAFHPILETIGSWTIDKQKVSLSTCCLEPISNSVHVYLVQYIGHLRRVGKYSGRNVEMTPSAERGQHSEH